MARQIHIHTIMSVYTYSQHQDDHANVLCAGACCSEGDGL